MLCLAAITNSFFLFSFFPYAGYMAVMLLNNNNNTNRRERSNEINVDNAGIYAGMLGAALTLGRFLGFVSWKVLRNVFGGKRALVLSLLLTGLASLWVGLSITFSRAILARFFQGISNGLRSTPSTTKRARRDHRSRTATAANQSRMTTTTQNHPRLSCFRPCGAVPLSVPL